jgi:hypothetical protein
MRSETSRWVLYVLNGTPAREALPTTFGTKPAPGDLVLVSSQFAFYSSELKSLPPVPSLDCPACCFLA